MLCLDAIGPAAHSLPSASQPASLFASAIVVQRAVLLVVEHKSADVLVAATTAPAAAVAAVAASVDADYAP